MTRLVHSSCLALSLSERVTADCAVPRRPLHSRLRVRLSIAARAAHHAHPALLPMQSRRRGYGEPLQSGGSGMASGIAARGKTVGKCGRRVVRRHAARSIGTHDGAPVEVGVRARRRGERRDAGRLPTRCRAPLIDAVIAVLGRRVRVPTGACAAGRESKRAVGGRDVGVV
jgi:hypothetical protein